jgi:hypothetical protein
VSLSARLVPLGGLSAFLGKLVQDLSRVEATYSQDGHVRSIRGTKMGIPLLVPLMLSWTMDIEN